MAVVAGVHLIVAIGSLVAILRSRRWLTIRSDSFSVREPSGTREFMDEQVIALADSRQTRFASGEAIGEIRRTKLWLAGPSGQEFTVCLLRFLGVDEADVMDVLIERLKCRIHENAVRELGRQVPVEAPGWELHNDELLVRGKNDSTVVSLDGLRAIDRHEGRLRLWLAAQKRPHVELRLSDRNVWLLEELLQDRLRAEPVSSQPVDGKPDGPLGRILAERRPSRWTSYSIYALGFFAAGVSIACCLVAFLAELIFPAIIGIAIGFPAAMIISLARRLSHSMFRICELGVEKQGVAGHQMLPYREIDVFVFDARRQHSYGRYTGTLYTLTFASRSRPQHGIFHSESTRHEDRVLETLRDQVSSEIAHRMARAYAASGVVAWTPELRILQGAVEYRPHRPRLRPWTRRQTVRIPFRDVLDYEIEGDWFHLWTIGEERAVVKVATASPNFFAGLVLLESICPLREDRTGVILPGDRI